MMRNVFAALLLLAFAHVTAASSVQYLDRAVAFHWTPQGLQARTQAGMPLWYFDPVTRSFTRAGLRFAPTVERCTAQGVAGGGPPRALLLDRNGDDRIDPAQGDTARLVFGASIDATTSQWFALDVSDPSSPALLWATTPAALPALGEPLSAPTFARLRIGASNLDPERFVVLLATGRTRASAPALRLVALDASTGTVLWSAGNVAGANLRVAALRHAMAGGIAALDIDGDVFADRLYAGDEAGTVWRFDLRDGAAADAFASATVLAQLDGALRGTPDVAFMQLSGGAFLNIAIATGLPDDSTTPGWLYALRDTQSSQALPPITAADLPIASASLPQQGRGWRLPLAAGEWLGAAPVTLNGRLLFTSFKATGEPEPDCEPVGTNRVHALTVIDASPALDLDADDVITARDRSRTLTQRELVHGVDVSIPRAPAPGEPQPPAPTCSVGSESLPGCIPASLIRRTFWYRSDAD